LNIVQIITGEQIVVIFTDFERIFWEKFKSPLRIMAFTSFVGSSGSGTDILNFEETSYSG
jgi:hypothetical protein